MSCDAHRDATNLTLSAPSLFSSGQNTGPMNSFCTVSTVLLRPTVAMLLAANGAAAGHVPGGDQHHQRSSARFVRGSGDNAVNELRHAERETQSLRDGVEQSARRLFAPSHGLRIDGLPPQVKPIPR